MRFIHELIESISEIQHDLVVSLGEEFPVMYTFVFFLAY
ncbi:hypothetical protein [Serratia phage X20]|uniref:Uncharacterized protein n=1 Tax=Serratia phage X20 TaxID=2006942 RepID=A0A1Z1LYY2_9CAUD|nr:hypothetical protein KNT72_gp067 [Serratia phage X20]ARW58040.1 hypothetical protein [Serratia phage X20]QYN80512.1 hypothetical protein [Kosakonia phage Kc304]UJJ22054.1 hypothetical protein [Erwinia phage Virsaitis27]